MSTEPTLKTFVSPKFINMGTGPTLKTFVILCLAVSCVIFKDVEGVRKKGLPPGLAKKVNNESPVPAQGNFGDLEGSLKNIENQLLDIVDDLPVQNKKSALYNPNARAGERFQSCLTPGGQRGSCTYLRQCPLPEIVISFTAFLEYMCFIQNTYVGVCCPNYYELSGPQSTPRPQPVTTPSSNKPISAVCGRNYDTRIVGGTAADPKDWIWMAALIRGPSNLRGQFCGGVLISHQYVLTAAHCTEGFTASSIKVRLGEYDFSRQDDNNARDFAVAEIKDHPNYDSRSNFNDISLLKLATTITFNDYIQPICLPEPGQSYINRLATVAGWGTTSYGGASSNVLREVTIPVWSESQCQSVFSRKIDRHFLCAGVRSGGKDSCQGDSGGPLMVENYYKRWMVIGVVSWGIRCAGQNSPGVYTRVTEYLNWIRANAV